MRVAFLMQWDPDEEGAFIGSMLAELEAQGDQVLCFTGVPSSAAELLRPNGWRKSRGGYGPFRALRYPYFHSHDSSSLRRMATYVSFAARNSMSFQDLASADVVLAYASPATVMLAPILARKVSGVPYVMMVQDVWPDSVFATGFLTSGMAKRTVEFGLGRFVSDAYRGAAAVTALSPGMRDLVVRRGANPRTTHVLYNWARQEVPVRPRSRAADQPLHLMYAGNMGPGQDLVNLLTALDQLPRDTARLSLVGEGADLPRLREEVAKRGLGDFVEFRGQVPQQDLPRVLAEADIHLVSLADRELFRITVPSKLQSLMAMALPILASCPGEVGTIVREAGCGWSVAPGNPAALAGAILSAAASSPQQLRAMGERGAQKYYSEMALAVGSRKLHRILRGAAR